MNDKPAILVEIENLMLRTYGLENRLKENSQYTADAHVWMFHVREVLLEWKKTFSSLEALLTITDFEKVPQKLEGFAEEVMFGYTGHNQWHMEQLLVLLKKYLPPDEDDDSDDNTIGEN
ncbi:MAG: hypothetical protein SF162_08335 [bacterium]|nr:hypothetical protein [bacterium]